MTSVDENLSEARRSFRSYMLGANKAKQRDITFRLILGNESCDMDSAVCSIVYADYLLRKGTFVMPVLNINRSRFASRNEVAYCLKKFGITKAGLLFRDSEEIKLLFDDAETNANKLNYLYKIELVDHYAVAEFWENIKSNITSVVDHREIPNNYHFPPHINATQIELVASCSTLIAEKIFDDKLSWDKVPNESLLMLVGTILVDSANLSGKSGQIAQKDFDLVQKLEKEIKKRGLNYSRNELFMELVSAKQDLSSLSNEDIIRKDMKIFSFNDNSIDQQLKIIFCSFPINLTLFFESCDNAMQLFQELITSNTGNAIIFMSSSLLGYEPEVKKQIAFWSADGKLYARLENIIVKQIEELNLTPLDSMKLNDAEKDESLIIYSQGNTKYSRKQLVPALKTQIEGIN